jgi:(p)ppGpp synthase/HD superfamily hydrolase
MSDLVRKAAHLAAKAHAGQLRKYGDVPYIIHPMRVAGRLTLLDDATDEMIAAGWLHDVIEDTTFSADDILQACGLEVLRLVLELTNAKTTGLNRAERKLVQRQKLVQVSREAKIIKCVDRLDNLNELPENDFRKLYVSESVDLFQAMVDRELYPHPAVGEDPRAE